MKATLNARTLGAALAKLKMVPMGSVREALNAVHIQAMAKKLRLHRTDLSTALTVEVPAEVVKQGVCVGDLARIGRVLSSAGEDEQVTLSLTKAGNLTAKTEHSSFRLRCVPAEKFPEIPTVPKGATEVNGADISTLFASVFHATSREDGRYTLHAIKLHQAKGLLKAAATDGRRASVGWVKTKGLKGDYLIPPHWAAHFRKFFGDAETVKLVLGDTMIALADGVTLFGRALDGVFPDYESMIPAPTKHTLTIPAEELHKALTDADSVCSAESRAVTLKFSESSCSIHGQSAEHGEAEVDVPSAVYEGGPGSTFSFNPAFLLDAITCVDDPVVMEFSEAAEFASRPVVLRADNSLHVIAPVRLRDDASSATVG